MATAHTTNGLELNNRDLIPQHTSGQDSTRTRGDEMEGSTVTNFEVGTNPNGFLRKPLKCTMFYTTNGLSTYFISFRFKAVRNI